MTGPLKNVSDAAEWLGISPRSLEAMVSARKVPFTKVGKHVRFAQEHLDAIVAAGEQAPIEVRPALLRLATAPTPAPKPAPAKPVTPSRPAAPATPKPPSGPKSPSIGSQSASAA